MDDDLLTIRQMTEEFDVTARALRFYESRELLAPQRIGQRRLYSRRDRARLKLILRGKRFGFSLEDIRQLLDLYEHGRGGREQMTRTVDAAYRRLEILQAQHDELGRAIDELKEEISNVEAMLKHSAA